MKVYTQQGQKRFDQVKPESINDNTQAVVSVYNGRIDGQNLPIDTIDKLKFAPSALTSTSTVKAFGFKWSGQTQDYYFVRRWNTYEGSLSVHNALYSVDLDNSNWSSGWNNLQDVATTGGVTDTFSDLFLEFTATSGTLSGCFDINFRHGLDVIDDGSGGYLAFSTKWWTRWGLFCNDILIAETGKVYPRLENLCVPFHLFIGSQNVRLELKYQTVNTGAEDAVSSGAGVAVSTKSRLELYGASIWACNTKR
jgi:hypothetical protein